MMSVCAMPSEAVPACIAPLAKLPVFLALDGRRCLVVGGTAAAAWKAELLAAAGAHVRVADPAPCPELVALAQAKRSTGRVELARRRWLAADLEAAAVLVADPVDEADLTTLLGAARRAGVPVNVIDRPEHCDFQFGSIVNRSPVVIGISTDGSAPVLGQTIRRRLETLLPDGLSSWALAASRLRPRIGELLPNRAARRRFWERFAEQALSGAAFDPRRFLAEREVVAHGGNPTAGRVTLVGAGPGDPELLTVKAIRALQAADVILFDALVSPEVLELARREAKRMLVGKRGHRMSCRQDDINALMVRFARRGKHVVRLKGGDPSIFGRSGEELDYLARQGIPVEIVPGVTAASGAAARLGISLTHRDKAHSVRYVTGHGQDGGLARTLDWQGLADPETSLVFYMAGRTGPDIAERLLRAGLPASTPVALVAGATRPEERTWIGSLAALAKADFPCFEGPVLIGIGAVFGRLASSDVQPAAAAGVGA